ncbi:hypothetical protein WR25_14148 [Diploscapter pachys]|uniref:Cytosolic fatty-acid binding proteins domain-containing protein n=1 Tax=Diploscapter pachys TaxID=2018661 RepID=A0A2A2KPJ9_9BILA|nr:hypothetical protein WR25_14148 [Diploscapter pachys]
MSPIDQFFGKWQLETHDNFENYMKELDVGMITRKGALASMALKPTLEISQKGDKYEFASKSTFKNSAIQFHLGEEFDEVALDGRHVKTKIFLEGDKLVQTQVHTKEGEKDTVLTRWVEGGSKLILIWKCGSVQSTWTFTKA